MKKYLKIILAILVIIPTIIIIAWMYKFNYLANQEWYDVDGNKIEQKWYDGFWNMIEIDDHIKRPKVSFKWFELYSWKEWDEWNFSLLEWTNRIKDCEEIEENKVVWIEKIKEKLENIDKENLFEITERVDNCKSFAKAPSSIYE